MTTQMLPGRYLAATVHNGHADWEKSALVDKPQTPASDRLPPRSSAAGETGEAWGTPTLRLAGTTFRSDK